MVRRLRFRFVTRGIFRRCAGVWSQLTAGRQPNPARRLVYWPQGILPSARLWQPVPRGCEVIALPTDGRATFGVLMPAQPGPESAPSVRASWHAGPASPPAEPLRPVRRSLPSRLRPARHLVPLLRPRVLAWLVGLGLWAAPASLPAQPPAVVLEDADSAAVLSFPPEEHTLIYELPNPFTALDAGYIVGIAGPGSSSIDVVTGWGSADTENGLYFKITQENFQGEMSPASDAVGRITYQLFDSDPPQDPYPWPSSPPTWTAPDTVYAVVKNGEVEIPLGALFTSPNFAVWRVNTSGSVEDGEWSTYDFSNRKFRATPNSLGDKGLICCTANVPGVGGDTDCFRILAGKRVFGTLSDVLTAEPVEGLVVTATPTDGAPATQAVTDANGRYSMLVYADNAFFNVSDNVSGPGVYSTYNDTLTNLADATVKNVKLPPMEQFGTQFYWLKDWICNSKSIEDSLGFWYGEGAVGHPERMAAIDTLLTRAMRDLGMPGLLFATTEGPYPQSPSNIKSGVNILWSDSFGANCRGPLNGYVLGGTMTLDILGCGTDSWYVYALHELQEFLGHQDTPTGGSFVNFNKYPSPTKWWVNASNSGMERELAKLNNTYKLDSDWDRDSSPDGTNNGNFSNP